MDTWPASRRNALRQALLETIDWLRQSDDSVYADPVSSLIESLAGHLRRIEADEAVDRQRLSLLFSPTGQLQETSIDNGWGAAFLRLAETVDASLPPDNAGPDEQRGGAVTEQPDAPDERRVQAGGALTPKHDDQ